MSVATGLARGHTASPELARDAVLQAIERSGNAGSGGILLFLSADFARDPQPALLAASRAAGSTRIIGCTAMGLFTEEDWVLDGPAAAAMVFDDGIALRPAPTPAADDQLLSLTAPHALDTSWLDSPGLRIGAVSGDATGSGPFRVWCGAKLSTSGRCETLLEGTSGHFSVSQGIRSISNPMQVVASEGYDLQQLGNHQALTSLARELPLDARQSDRIPLHLIMAGVIVGPVPGAVAEGRFKLVPVIATNTHNQSVTLAQPLEPGSHMFWAMRQPLAAERNMRVTLDNLQQIAPSPEFLLLFPCMGRGPYFYGGVDRDWELTRDYFPGTPIIGFYGNGEIAPFEGKSQLFQYAAVIGAFSRV